ncbi:MAG: 2-succinyl-6-hydroxy-2,4-cyclohexadiene-1-carboxy late synthase [Anaerolineae bacterium]
MSTVTINCCDYHVEIQGDGVPLVLLHGFTGSTENWHGQIERLSHHYTVIAIDLPGHGRTASPPDPERYRMAHVAADLHKLLTSLTAAPVNLLGYSMGGRLALYFALHYPDMVMSLVLESASPGLADAAAQAARRAQDEALARRIETEGIPAFVDYWENIPLFESQRRLPETVRAALRQQRLANNPVGLANSLRGMGTGVQPSLWDRLPELTRPALLMAGELDTKFVGIAREMHALLPQSQLIIVPDAGHTIHLEQPQALEIQVQMFILRVYNQWF